MFNQTDEMKSDKTVRDDVLFNGGEPVEIVRDNVPDYAPRHEARIKLYPMGGYEIMACNRPIFAEYPAKNPKQKKKKSNDGLAVPAVAAKDPKTKTASDSGGMDRAMRRARAKVRDIALSNKFRWFVTLTLDKAKIDRYDKTAVVRTLNRWLDNRVRRDGLAYVLVPERHKDGAIHFHGLFTDCLAYDDSGHTDSAGHPIYNLRDWTLGFSAAIEIYGDYPRAVSYVCKYIGKQGDKVAGRWYYSGGKLAAPDIIYPELTITELNITHDDAYMFQIPESGLYISVVRGNSVDELTFSGL